MKTTEERTKYYDQLAEIASINGECYFRRLSYREANTWLTAYWDQRNEGFPHEAALQRTWDFYFSGRRYGNNSPFSGWNLEVF